MVWYDDIEKLKEGITQNRLEQLYDLCDKVVAQEFSDLTVQEVLVLLNYMKVNAVLSVT